MTDNIENSDDTVLNLNEEVQVVTETNENNMLNFSDAQNPAMNLPLRIKAFYSETDLIKFIKCVERLVRGSIEYKYWVSYITDNLGKNKCVLSHEKLNECDLDVHHHPINLFDIVKVIVNDKISKEESFNTFDIASKTIELHYQNKVGFMVLLSNLHKKYHDGFQKLPIEYVNGDYNYLLDNYNFGEDERRRIEALKEITIDQCKLGWASGDYPGLKEAS